MTVRDLIYPAIWLFSTVWYVHLAIVEWLGYPAVPSTTTNDFWTLVQLNTEILVLTLLVIIPAMILGLLTTVVIMALASLGRVLSNYALYGTPFPSLREVNIDDD